MIGILTVSVLISTALLAWAYSAHPVARPTPRSLAALYLCGGILPLASVVLETALDTTLPILARAQLGAQVLDTLSVGLIEEGIKLAVLLSLARPRVRHPYDGVLFGLAVGLGFATVENFPSARAFLADGDPVGAVLQGVGRIALDAILGVVMGYLFGRATFTNDRKASRWWLLAAWLLPSLLHAWNNLMVAADLPPKTFCLYLLVMLSLLILLLLYARDAILVPPKSEPPPESAPTEPDEPARAAAGGSSSWFCRTCATLTDHLQGRCLQCGSMTAPQFLT